MNEKKMNKKLVKFIKNTIKVNGIKYTYISDTTGIKYQRLMRIFNQNAIVSGSELICVCKCLHIDFDKLMKILGWELGLVVNKKSIMLPFKAFPYFAFLILSIISISKQKHKK